MKMTSLSLIVAGVLAVAGVAQAETFDSPTQAGEASTMTDGQPNLLTNNIGYPEMSITTVPGVIVDTTVLGAPPATITWVDPVPVYVAPSVTYLPPPVLYWNGMPAINSAPGSLYYGD
jgi:hypothetical protein